MEDFTKPTIDINTNSEEYKFNREEEKQKILNDPRVKELIISLNLTESQINNGMGFIQKYYNEKDPQWKLYVSEFNEIEMDISNVTHFKRQKLLQNFWLTNITALDADLKEYFYTNKKKSKKILEDAYKSMQNFYGLKEFITELTSKKKSNLGLLLIDENISDARNILKYLAVLYGTNKNRTVAFIEANNLYSFYFNNAKNVQLINDINSYLEEVDYLILDKFGIGTKPEWFLDNLLNIFLERERNYKPIFVSTPIDISKSNSLLTYASSANQKFDTGANKLEKFLKKTILRLTTKFVSKPKS
ncbi:hypothetical protein PT313_00910 [Metamycoplasma hyosynoviae]|uniref:hypothetical protein n=1 Tax=Metamycoplasma hyosynoviae TaxID=29559 RepID=UPI0023580CA0|nr:hypothetical protein [Metamycoplasma hyosynoviae]MDC8913898.1 hypothetical protein [Metamycoplasma hyosynoviae]MDC8914278.1 hypothetical protein [Metamycoplasma hyosynoviae]MDC8921223.1 hypothetical protein [Metamycoplasma hyosynoviae]MDC8937859.1 hypothetical protein [Metamycoplasma hyosynoviae]MDD1360077.1 hypothetical protein [Metamycoplasma hyosynoviae]